MKYIKLFESYEEEDMQTVKDLFIEYADDYNIHKLDGTAHWNDLEGINYHIKLFEGDPSKSRLVLLKVICKDSDARHKEFLKISKIIKNEFIPILKNLNFDVSITNDPTGLFATSKHNLVLSIRLI